jgi:hypothetical protein
MITFKVDGMTKDQVKSVVEPIVAGLVDIRDTIP